MIGDSHEAMVIRRIFDEFVDKRYSEYRIAERLNSDNVPSPNGGLWAGGAISVRLRNEKYIGTMVYNKTTQKLKTPTRRNSPDKWVRTQEAFEGLIPIEQFILAQQIIEERRRKYDPQQMLSTLDSLIERHGMLHASFLRLAEEMPSSSAFSTHFGSLDLAFQEIYAEQRDEARQEVLSRIRRSVPEVLPYADFLVLGQKLTVSVQPSVPVDRGYCLYWPFRADSRSVIDLTLGVFLSEPEEPEILGYVALPRWLAGKPCYFCLLLPFV